MEGEQRVDFEGAARVLLSWAPPTLVLPRLFQEVTIPHSVSGKLPPAGAPPAPGTARRRDPDARPRAGRTIGNGKTQPAKPHRRGQDDGSGLSTARPRAPRKGAAEGQRGRPRQASPGASPVPGAARRPRLTRRFLGAVLLAILACLLLLSLAHGTASIDGGQAPVRGLRAVTPQPECPPSADGIPQPGPCGDTWRYAAAANPDGHIVAPPSASATAIWQALSAQGSPLADNTPRRDGRTYAEYLWDAGKRSGIDPGVVMGFFNAESNYGTKGIALRTHDLANERPVPGHPVRCSNDGCYVYDDTWFDGIDRIYGLLADYARRGMDTADKAIPTWAPSTDRNDDAVYSRNVRVTMQALTADS